MDTLPAYLLLALFIALACGFTFVILTRINKAIRPERRVRRRWIMLAIAGVLTSGAIIAVWCGNEPESVFMTAFGEQPTADVVIRDSKITMSLNHETTRLVFTASPSTVERLKLALLLRNEGDATPAVDRHGPIPDFLRFNSGDETFRYDRAEGVVIYERSEYLD